MQADEQVGVGFVGDGLGLLDERGQFLHVVHEKHPALHGQLAAIVDWMLATGHMAVGAGRALVERVLVAAGAGAACVAVAAAGGGRQ